MPRSVADNERKLDPLRLWPAVRLLWRMCNGMTRGGSMTYLGVRSRRFACFRMVNLPARFSLFLRLAYIHIDVLGLFCFRSCEHEARSGVSNRLVVGYLQWAGGEERIIKIFKDRDQRPGVWCVMAPPQSTFEGNLNSLVREGLAWSAQGNPKSRRFPARQISNGMFPIPIHRGGTKEEGLALMGGSER